jgi:hypothetical protein
VQPVDSVDGHAIPVAPAPFTAAAVRAFAEALAADPGQAASAG